MASLVKLSILCLFLVLLFLIGSGNLIQYFMLLKLNLSSFKTRALYEGGFSNYIFS